MSEHREAMPERVWCFMDSMGCPTWSPRHHVLLNGTPNPEHIEYTRSDLVPSWQDRPTCAGLWMDAATTAWSIRLWRGELRIEECDCTTTKITYGPWYGPIPPVEVPL